MSVSECTLHMSLVRCVFWVVVLFPYLFLWFVAVFCDMLYLGICCVFIFAVVFCDLPFRATVAKSCCWNHVMLIVCLVSSKLQYANEPVALRTGQPTPQRHYPATPSYASTGPLVSVCCISPVISTLALLCPHCWYVVSLYSADTQSYPWECACFF